MLSSPAMTPGLVEGLEALGLAGFSALGLRVSQRHDFCMRPASHLGVALADDLPLRVDQHTAYAWVG